MSTPISPPSPTRTPEEIELPLLAMLVPALVHPASQDSSNSSSDPSTGTSSQRGSSANVAAATERRAGGMSSHSANASSSGIKTPRKNVQWAASTKGEGPMGAAEHPHPHLHLHRAGPSSSHTHRQTPSETEIRHMHLLDKEGLDPKAFQTLTHALERHQSTSHDNSPSQSHTTIRRDFADHHNNSSTMDRPGSSSGSDLRSRRSEAPRLTSLPPNPFSDANRVSTSNPFEIFTPTTLSPIHSDAGTSTDEHTPERTMPGEVIIESTEKHGLPRPLPASASNNSAERLKSSSSSGGRLASRFSRFPFRSSSKDDYATSSTGIGDGALGGLNALDTEEEEKRRLEKRASKLVRAHARGFQFLAGFKGNKALQHMAPEDIDPDAPLPRRPTRFSRQSASSAAMERKRSRSAPAPSSPPVPEIRSERDKSTESTPDNDESQSRGERRGLFSFRRRSQSHSRTRSESRQREDEDVENTAAYRHTHHAPLALGSGVLSALLTLYDRNTGPRSGFTTPGDRTPSESEPTSPVSEVYPAYNHSGRRKEKEERSDYFGKRTPTHENDDDERQRDELQRINTRLNAGSMFDNEREREEFERERSRERSHERKIGLESGSKSSSSSELTPPHPLYAQRNGTRSLQSLRIKGSFSDLTRTMSGGIERIKEKTSPTKLTALPIPRIPIIGGGDLPSGARSGAGVFGGLIASTGNLAGVAAPAASRIGPDPKRPGFHLSRYSWSEEGCSAEAEEALRRIKKTNKSNASGFRTPGNSPRSSRSMVWSKSETGLLGLGGNMNDSLTTLGMSRSAPTTPAGEVPSSIFDLVSSGATPSPASDDSPASVTPLMIPSRANLITGDASPSPALRHGQSRSIDSTAPLLGNRLSVGGHMRAQSDNLSLTTVPTGGSAATSTTLNNNSSTGTSTPGAMMRKWALLKDFRKNGSSEIPSRSGAATPDTTSDAGSHDHWDEKHRRWASPSASAAEEKRKRKRKKAEIFITRHVAEIMQRQEFILKLARAFMMFGAPSHRLPAQIQATARVLDMELSCMYLPDVMLISFDDAATSTSNIKFIRQGAALSLGKLQDAYNLYWKVIHDEVGVGEASRALDALMQQKPPYSTWQLALFGGFCSAAICQVSFTGSFIDCLIAFPLGMFLVFVQILSVRNELYSNVFEITITTLLSFLAAVFAGTHHFCYSAVASGSIVLILPGFLVLNGSLELSSRNIVSGAVRLCYAVMYALFLGFGLSIGGTLYEKFTGKAVASPEDYTCATSHHPNGPWYQRTPSGHWAFLTVPMFSLFLTLRNQAPWWKKELIVTVIISCIGWTCNHFSALKFPGRNDVSSAIGAFAVGFVANLYGRFFSGNAFVIMITGILFQLPSGLGNGGLITFASQNNTSGTSTSYLSGFKTASQLISVSVGLTVGLGISLVVIFPIQSRKRAGGIFSL